MKTVRHVPALLLIFAMLVLTLLALTMLLFKPSLRNEAEFDILVDIYDDTLSGASSTVAVTPQTIYLDNERCAVAGYNIANSNYFKLRDIAAVLSSTSATFDVSWNEAKSLIEIIKGVQYVSVAGDIVASDNSSLAVSSVKVALLTGNTKFTLDAFNINDNNYFKLRDLAPILDFEVDYVQDTDSIYLSTGVIHEITPKSVSPSDVELFYEFMASEIKKYTPRIEVASFNISRSAVADLLCGFWEAYPELFYIEHKFSSTVMGERVIALVPFYTDSAEELVKKQVVFDQRLSEAISEIDLVIRVRQTGGHVELRFEIEYNIGHKT